MMTIQPSLLQPEQCCLYVVDPQERLMAHIYEADRVIHNIRLMINMARILHIPVIVNTQYKKGIGPIVQEIDCLLEGIPCPDKITFNGLANQEVRKLLKKLSGAIDTLLICGVESHICIYQTVVGALQNDYHVTVVADAISSRTPANDSLGQARMVALGADLKPAEMIIYELLKRAGTTEFKAMLPFLK